MIHKHPLKLSKIDELLSPSRNAYQERNQIVAPERYMEAEYLAKILWQLELDTPRIDRALAIELLKGQALWETRDKGIISLKQDFEFEILEELGILICEHNWVHINAKLPDRSEYNNFDDSLMPVLCFSQNLKDILSGYNNETNLRPVTFSINKKKYEEILPKSFTFNHHNVEINDLGMRYEIDIKEDGWGAGSLVCDYFWSIFNEQTDIKEAINKFFDLRVKYSYVIRYPYVKKFNNKDSDHFKTLHYDCLNKSKLVNLSLMEYKNYLLSESYFHMNLTSTDRTLNLNASEGKSIKDIVKRTPNTLTDVIQLYKEMEEIDSTSDLELMKWSDRHDSRHHFFDDLAYLALRNISRTCIYIDDYSRSHKFDEFEEVIDLSLNRPVLRILLIKHIPFDSENKVSLYFLSKPEFIHIGFNNLLREVKIKFGKNADDYKEVTDNAINMISTTLINVCKNSNNITLVTPIIIEIVSNNIGEYRTRNDIDMMCLSKIFSLIEPERSEELFSNIIESIGLDSFEKNSRHKLFLLFKMFKYSVENHTSIRNKILDKLIYFYSSLIKKSFEKNDITLGADSFFDELEWSYIDSKEAIEKLMKLMPTPQNVIAKYFKCESSARIDYINNTSHYIQVLVNILKLKHDDKDKAFKYIREISLFFGFKSEHIPYPLFGDYLPSVYKEKYDLWASITKVLDTVQYEYFKGLVDEILEVAPASALLQLSSSTSIDSRKKYITDTLNRSELDKVQELSISDLEKAFLLALEQRQLKIASNILEKSKNFFKEHHHKNNSIYKEKFFHWQVLEYKYNLLKVYYSDIPHKDKWEELTNIRAPENPDKNNFNINHHDNDSEIFYRYVLGLTKLSYEPKTSLNIFTQLYMEHRTDNFSYLILLAEYHCLESKNTTADQDYSDIIRSYKYRNTNFNFLNLDVEKKAFFMNLLYLCKKNDEIKDIFMNLTDVEKNSKPITLIYSKYLRSINDTHTAIKLIESYKNYNSPYQFDADIEEEQTSAMNHLKDIRNSSCDEKSISYDDSIADIGIKDTLLDIRYLRNAFNEIKGRPAKELSKIISPSSVELEVFLYDEMISCAKEILSRSSNLSILRKNKNENVINDWFISLFNFRFSLFKPYISEQRRMGKPDTINSAGIGELDGLIVDTGSGPISIYEAMNLECLDNAIIDKHLNKLSKYDTVGLSPIFVVAFCYFNKFDLKSKQYLESLKHKQYFGFQSIDNKTHSIKKIDSLSNLLTAVETRYKSEQKVNIFHILIDLS